MTVRNTRMALEVLGRDSNRSAKAPERFANSAITTLDGGIGTSDTQLIVNSTAALPTAGRFHLLVDSEIILVTSVGSDNTLQIVRAQEGTAAATHSDTTGLRLVLTAASLHARESDAICAGSTMQRFPQGTLNNRLWLPSDNFLASVDTGSAYVHHGCLNKLTPPVVGDFAWVNQGTSTFTDTNDVVVLTPEANNTSTTLRIVKKAAPSTPYKITVAFLHQWGGNTGQVPFYGVCWRESGTGNLIVIGHCNNPQNESTIFHEGWNSGASSGTNTRSTAFETQLGPMIWLRFGDDGTNRWFEHSTDGVNWVFMASESRTAYLTANEVGLYARTDITTSKQARTRMTVLHWSEG